MSDFRTEADRQRASKQVERLLDMLRRGPVTNVELIGAGLLKYTSRISDARKLGYDIECERLTGGLSRYTLKVHDGTQLDLLAAGRE